MRRVKKTEENVENVYGTCIKTQHWRNVYFTSVINWIKTDKRILIANELPSPDSLENNYRLHERATNVTNINFFDLFLKTDIYSCEPWSINEYRKMCSTHIVYHMHFLGSYKAVNFVRCCCNPINPDEFEHLHHIIARKRKRKAIRTRAIRNDNLLNSIMKFPFAFYQVCAL